MKLSRKWLNEFIDLSLEEKNDRDFAEAMTMSGSKVEGTDYMGEGISRVVVGKIVAMDLLWDAGDSGKHTLWNCKVDVGGERDLQIITGAQNQKVGDLVPVALDGATLPGGVTIGKGSVISAGSVVTRDIPAGVVAAGSPCRVIRPVTEKDRIPPEQLAF